MKKIMILGASVSQVPLIRAAKALGLYTVVVSTPGDWPGFVEADACSYTDITDSEAVFMEAEKYGIDGIATCCMDAGVPSIGFVCEKMGLCGPSALAAKTARNKYLMKEAFRKGGVSSAEHIRVTSPDELQKALKKLGFPVAVKAVDQMGSRGIYRCDTMEEAKKRYEEIMENSAAGCCLVEEFIEGTLFNGEAMIRNGEFVFCLVDNTEAFPAAVPTPIGHSVPFEKEEELGERARAEMKKAVKAVGYDNSAVDFDLLCKDGEVYVVEINGRAGATCLPELVGMTYGLNYYEALVKLAMGEEVAQLFHTPGENRSFLSHTLLSQETGKLLSIEDRVDHSDPAIIQLAIDVKPGDQIKKYTNGRDRLGQVILQGRSLSENRQKLEEILSGLQFNLEP